jgi:hypothetical protein
MSRRRSLEDETNVTCPYCSKTQLLVVDPETQGELVQDCDVCCHPWRLWVSRDEEGALVIDVSRAQ